MDETRGETLKSYGSPKAATPDREAIKIVQDVKQRLLVFIEHTKSQAARHREMAEFYTNEADVAVSFLQQDYYAAKDSEPKNAPRPQDW